MKYLLSLVIFLTSILTVAAQVTPKSNTAKSGIGSGIDLFTDFWMDLPAGVEARTINQGMNFYAAYRNPIGTSPFATSIAISIGAHNLYSNSFLDRDTSGLSIFIPIPSTSAAGQKIDYKRNKLALAYLDLPLELVLKTEKGFSASLGVKAGILLNAHTKYRGDDPGVSGTRILVKQGELANIETYRLGGIVRIGYKWVNLYGSYSFSKIFKEDLGPAVYPVSIGVSLRPY